MIRIVRLTMLAALAYSAHAQNTPAPVVPPVPAPVWVTISPESATVSVTLPAGATYRFGDAVNNLWSAPITVQVATTFSPVFFPSGVFPFSDPDPNTAKELDVLETADAQGVTITDLSTSPVAVTTQIVPALAAPPPAHTVTFTNFQNTAVGQTALLFAFANLPDQSGAGASVWEGTQMDIAIDGVTWTCSYGQNYTDQVYTLNCNPPTP